MKLNRLFNAFLLIGILISSAGCRMPALKNMPELNEILSLPAQPVQSGELLAASLPTQAETLVTFQVSNPPDAQKDEQIYLVILDEVTGLALNSTAIALEPTSMQAGSGDFSITLPFSIGSLIKYRYERQATGIRVAEHLSDGRAVRYRMLLVTGEKEVKDVISRWTDTEYQLPSGRIQGQIIDSKSQLPVPNILISAAGAQTLSRSDGSFMLESLPPGVHQLVAYALDGSYQTFQQGAEVAEGSTTPAVITMTPAEFSNIVFVVSVPEGTPPVVPLRMAGNLLQMGNSYADLSAGMSTLAANMPVLTTLPDGRYTITIALPIGADIRYKYTLGDGFWNAERSSDGSFKLRQLIVPDQTILIEESIQSWKDDPGNSITFDLQVPADTLPTDILTIQFDPLFGWTEPLPMWKLGDTRWAYVLYSPLNLPGELSYRYCRNYQCDSAGELPASVGSVEIHKVRIQSEPQTITDQIAGWVDWSASKNLQIPPVENVIGRGDGYRAGFELSTGYHPSWDSLYTQTIEDIQGSHSNLVIFTPTWSYGHGSEDNILPILAPLPGHDPNWFQMAKWIEQTQIAGIHTALKPEVNFPTSSSDWWENSVRDESWWQVWFEQYRSFAVHYADLAERSNAQTLMLGGEWVLPALPDGKLPDGSASDVPEDSALRWQNLLSEVRTHYHGQIGWVISAKDIANPPAFIDLVDRTFVELVVEPGSTIEESLGQDLETWLDVSLLPFQFQSAKPLLLGAACPSDPDLQTQLDCYQKLLEAVNRRDWISGFISLDYYPPVALQDRSASVHGKPAEQLLGLWYPEMVK